MKTTRIIMVTLMVLVSVAALTVSARAAVVPVRVFDNDFDPDPTINLNDTVRWEWDTTIFLHSTTSASGLLESWDSGLQDYPFTFDHTFTNLGSFAYCCSSHGFDNLDGTTGGMAGIVTVVPEPATIGLLSLGAMALIGRRRR